MSAQKNILDYLKSMGIYNFKVVTANRSGIPDIIACVPVMITPDMAGSVIGRFVGIEVKVGNDTASELQLYNIDKIRGCGGEAFIAKGKNHALTVVKNYIPAIMGGE